MASTGLAIVLVTAVPCAQPFGTLTEKAPSDDVTGPNAPVTSRPRTKRPTTTTPAPAPPPSTTQIGHLMPEEPDWAGAGKGASAVGWVTAGDGASRGPDVAGAPESSLVLGADALVSPPP